MDFSFAAHPRNTGAFGKGRRPGGNTRPTVPCSKASGSAQDTYHDTPIFSPQSHE